MYTTMYISVMNVCNNFLYSNTVKLLRELGNTWQQIADILMISRTTLWGRVRELGLPTSRYSQLSDSELDSVMPTLVQRFPNNGTTLMWGHLKSLNIAISCSRVHDSVLCVSRHLVGTRQRTTVNRRASCVPAPNFLWHIDGLHCLIRWRIVLHGGIDGYSRRVLYLHASDNTRALAVVRLFRSAVHTCGWPFRVRFDRGGETVEVARAMLSVCGTGRKCYLVGSSVHNQRIERLWRDTFRCVCHFFLFTLLWYGGFGY